MYIYTYIHTHIHIYVCVCIYTCTACPTENFVVQLSFKSPKLELVGLIPLKIDNRDIQALKSSFGKSFQKYQ